MKKLMLFTLLSVLAISCSKEAAKQEVKVEKYKAEIPEEDTFPYDTLQGMYMGDFGGSPIRIILNYVSETNAIGYDIHKGLQRNIMGKVSRSGDSIQIVLSEPGDNEYDGIFTIDFIGMDNEPTGVWDANDKKIPSQSFKLKKVDKNVKAKKGEITIGNFASTFEMMTDTIGEYNFLDDGLVILKYYPTHDGEWDKQQYKELKGSWSLEGKKVTINWEPSKFFKNNRLELTIVPSEYEYEPPILKGQNGHELWPMWYW